MMVDAVAYPVEAAPSPAEPVADMVDAVAYPVEGAPSPANPVADHGGCGRVPRGDGDGYRRMRTRIPWVRRRIPPYAHADPVGTATDTAVWVRASRGVRRRIPPYGYAHPVGRSEEHTS